MDVTPATPVTPPEGILSPDGKLRLYGYKNAPPQPLAPPKIVDLKPLVQTLAPGRYSWCSCGYSNKQPFCDDSHRHEENATNRRSYKFEVLQEARIEFCMCKHTGNPPYCDNTCKQLASAVNALAPATATFAPLQIQAPALPTIQQASASARAVIVQPRMSAASAFLLLLGRIALAYIFIRSGINHLTGLDHTADSVAGAMPFIPEQLHSVVALLAGVMLLVGSVLLVLGFGARFGALLLVLFLIPTLLFFHNFWAAPPDDVRMQTIQFQKNLAMIGGLLAIMASGAGPLSLDALYRKKT